MCVMFIFFHYIYISMLVRRSIGRIKKMRTYIFVSLVYFKLWRVDKVLLHVFSETVDKTVFFFSYLGFMRHSCFSSPIGVFFFW